LKLPLILWIASGSQALPILASFKYGRKLSVPRRWIVGLAVLLILNDAVLLWYARQGISNLWITYLARPLVLATVLMALSYWQPSARIRTLYRMAIPVFLVILLVVSVLVEDRTTYSLITGPFEDLILFAASLATVLVGAWRLEGSLAKQDWFWVGIGLALMHGTSAGFDPVARILVGRDIASLETISKVAAWIDLAASLLIVGGMLCPIPRLRVSSGPTLSASSPSPSSSPHSAPPW